jgi:hypothetical protein
MLDSLNPVQQPFLCLYFSSLVAEEHHRRNFLAQPSYALHSDKNSLIPRIQRSFPGSQLVKYIR